MRRYRNCGLRAGYRWYGATMAPMSSPGFAAYSLTRAMETPTLETMARHYLLKPKMFELYKEIVL